MRIDWREYKEQSKRVGNQREREQRECRDRWRVRTKRAGKQLVEFFFVFILDFFIYVPMK